MGQWVECDCVSDVTGVMTGIILNVCICAEVMWKLPNAKRRRFFFVLIVWPPIVSRVGPRMSVPIDQTSFCLSRASILLLLGDVWMRYLILGLKIKGLTIWYIAASCLKICVVGIIEFLTDRQIAQQSSPSIGKCFIFQNWCKMECPALKSTNG